MGYDAEAPPPSYNSLFGELQAQKSQSDGVVNYAKNAASVCCGKVVGVVAIVIFIILVITLGLALPIAEIVIGSKYLHECPAQRYLTIYLVVMGTFSIVQGCSSSGSKASSRDSDDDDGNKGSSFCSCCNSLVGAFLTAWFICGNVWVFKMQPCIGKPNGLCFTTDVNYSNTTSYCNSLVYDFVYWETIAKWAVLGLFTLIGCLCCFVICCAYCCGKGDDE